MIKTYSLGKIKIPVCIKVSPTLLHVIQRYIIMFGLYHNVWAFYFLGFFLILDDLDQALYLKPAFCFMYKSNGLDTLHQIRHSNLL